jgi:hypothetical protein
MRTNQKSFLNSKPGRYNGNMMFHANAVYYSFTDVAGAIRQRCSIPAYEQVCEQGSIDARLPDKHVKAAAGHQRFLNAKCRY